MLGARSAPPRDVVLGGCAPIQYFIFTDRVFFAYNPKLVLKTNGAQRTGLLRSLDLGDDSSVAYVIPRKYRKYGVLTADADSLKSTCRGWASLFNELLGATILIILGTPPIRKRASVHSLSRRIAAQAGIGHSSARTRRGRQTRLMIGLRRQSIDSAVYTALLWHAGPWGSEPAGACGPQHCR